MYEASVREFATADGAVMCAAVADYTPEEVAPTKLKKGDGELTIRLKRTHDIAPSWERTKRVGSWSASPSKPITKRPMPKGNSNAKTSISSF